MKESNSTKPCLHRSMQMRGEGMAPLDKPSETKRQVDAAMKRRDYGPSTWRRRKDR
jgi:hypothetical protein